MENLTEKLLQFSSENIDYYLFILIILSGLFVTKYNLGILKISNKYRVLIIATLVSVASYYINESGDVGKYVITYALSTTFYELIVKSVKDKINKFFEIKE